MKKNLMPYVLLAPFVVLMIIFFIGLISGIIQSFGIIPSFDLTQPTLKYYKEVFANKNLYESILFSLFISTISSLLAVLIGTAFCYMIIRLKKTKSKWIHIIRLPIMVPHTVVALFIISILSQTGIISRLLCGLGIIDSFESFPNIMYSEIGIPIILAYLWKEVPFVCFFVIAVMGNIASSYEEVAMNLGASKLKSFTAITLPLSMPTIKNTFLIIWAFSFGAYELPFLLGPTVPKALPVQAFIEYQNPDLLHRPYAMVLNVIAIVIGLIMLIFYMRITKKERRIQ